jgi:hypothetical protein
MLSASAARRLRARTPLAIDPRRAIAIKRNVHEVEVDVDAARLAESFNQVMCEPDARFDLVRIKRPAERVGQPFEVGDRFHGCFSLELGRLGEFVEDTLLSDYAEVTAIERSPSRWRAEYVYLSGSPIAGRSEFVIEPATSSRARFTAVFHFQEVGALALSVLHRFAARVHDRVVLAQVTEAARRAGGRVIASTFA